MKLIFATLGPTGSCHEYALRHYLSFCGLSGKSEILLVTDFLDTLEMLRAGTVDHIVQGCVHPTVMKVIETYHTEVFVIDSFLFATQEMALLTRKDRENPTSLGLMPATGGYVDLSKWTAITHEISKPVVGQNLLAGKYDAGISYTHIAEANPAVLTVEKVIGCVVQPWLVYGTRPRFQGEVIAKRDRSLYSRSSIMRNSRVREIERV